MKRQSLKIRRVELDANAHTVAVVREIGLID